MSYDSILNLLGEFGPYQKRLFCLLFFTAFPNAFQIYSIVFCNIEPEFRCAVPGLPNDTYAIQSESHLQLVMASIPALDNDTGRYSGLHTYQPIEEEEEGATSIGNSNSNSNSSSSSMNNSGWIQTLAFNQSRTVACHRWVYSRKQLHTSFVADFNLVGDRKMLKSHLNMMLMLGMLTGSFIGALSDVIGRKTFLILTIIGQAVSGINIAFVTSFTSLLALRCLITAFGINIFFNGFIMLMEFVGPGKRVAVGQGLEVGWCVALFIVLIVHYFIRVWRTAQLIISFPPLLLVLYYWLIPESPRWLMTKGRFQEAQQIFQNVAKFNRVKLPPELNISSILEEEQNKSVEVKKIPLWTILTNRIVMLRLLVLCLGWMVMVNLYYGLSLYVGDIVEGDLYLNYSLFVIMELMGYILCFWLLDKVGRKWLYCGSLFLAGFSCLAASMPKLAGSDHTWVSVTFASLGKFGTTCAFATLMFITTELLPTVIRNSGLGVCALVGNIGGIVSPYIASLSLVVPGVFGEILPMIIFGSWAIILGFASLVFSETRNRKLPETLEDFYHYDRCTNGEKPLPSDHTVKTKV